MTYRELLTEAWQEHLAPRATNAPTVISLFAGGGGSMLGYRMAGYNELAAVEREPVSAASLRLNFPDVKVLETDIHNLSADSLMQIAGIKPRQLSVLDGSPPCQGFSTSGNRNLNDPRNQLFREFVRILTALQPQCFLMENVSGLVLGKMRPTFAKILGSLKDSGYDVVARVLDASWFNVPQIRQRVIILGCRSDLHKSLSHPQPMPAAIRWSCQKAIEDLTIDPKTWSKLGNSRRWIWPKLRPYQLGNTVVIGNFYSVRKLSPHRPCGTLTRGNKDLFHWSEPRALTLQETQRMASFPDEYQWPVKTSLAQRMSRLGNAVPPLFMRAIASHVRKTILEI